MSSTVDKALGLLTHFSQSHPELGLSELSRLAEVDKATVHRFLGVLCKHGLLEQDNTSRLYRLGAGTLRLARNREASFPVASIIDATLQNLSGKTGETTHASMIAGNTLATVGVVKGNGPIHVNMEAGEILPFHATASGLACLAFLPEEKVKALLQRKLASYTEKTARSEAALRPLLEMARSQGIAQADQFYESDVYGIAAPIFGNGGHAIGALAITTPAHRMTRELKQTFGVLVRDAAIETTRKLGAEPPQGYASQKRKAAA